MDLNLNNITNNKKFWITMKPFFDNKGVSRDKITLIKGEDIISDYTAVAKNLNTLFGNAVKSPDIASAYKYNI